MTQNLKPGINHIEIWVSNVDASIEFYSPIFKELGWRKVGTAAFATDSLEIYFKESDVQHNTSLGVRHICLQATTRGQVQAVASYLQSTSVITIRGPVEMAHYSPAYYTVDFHDPDGLIIEVAHTPNLSF